MSLEKGVEQEVEAEVLVTGPDNGSQQHIGPAIWLLLTAVTFGFIPAFVVTYDSQTLSGLRSD